MLKDIPGYEGIYQITPCGVITSKYSAKPLKGWVEATGYRAVSLTNEMGKTRVTVHTLLANIFIPNPLNCPEVNHIDGVKLNNCLTNLEWVFGVENIRHAFTNGLTRNPACVDYAKVPALLAEVIAGTSLDIIAKREGIKEASTLRKLLSREATRTGQNVAFNTGTALARKSIIAARSFKVNQLDVNKTVVRDFSSINEAARSVGKNPASIFKALKHGRLYLGYFWERKHA